MNMRQALQHLVRGLLGRPIVGLLGRPRDSVGLPKGNSGLPKDSVGLLGFISSLSPRLRHRLIKEIIRIQTKQELFVHRYKVS